MQLKEGLELVISAAENTQSYHLRRRCLGRRGTRGSLGGSEWLKAGCLVSFPVEGLKRLYEMILLGL